MFIRVKYGDNETLLCNPNCSIVSLLSHIRSRSGQTDDDVVLDLTDETGLESLSLGLSVQSPSARLPAGL